jgi:hypothetical protein
MDAKEYYVHELQGQGVPEDEIQESLNGFMVKTTLTFAEDYARHRLLMAEIESDKPPFPGPRLIREGSIGDCPKCKSTTVKRFIWFGKMIGCINPRCDFYYKRYETKNKKNI